MSDFAISAFRPTSVAIMQTSFSRRRSRALFQNGGVSAPLVGMRIVWE